MPQAIIPTTEKQNLIGAIQRISKELSTILEEIFLLRHKILPALHEEYDTHFKLLVDKIQKKQLEEREYHRYAELLLIKLQRGEHLTESVLQIIQSLVRQEFNRIRSRLEGTRADLSRKHASEYLDHDASQIPISKQPDTVRLYKALAKQLHPDSSYKIDNADEYWHIVQDLYKRNKIMQLKEIHQLIETRTLHIVQDHQDNTIAHLQQQHRIVDRHLARAQKKLFDLKKDTLLTIGASLQNETWRTLHQQELLQQYADIEDQLHTHKRTVQSLCIRYNIDRWELLDTRTNDMDNHATFSDITTQNIYFGSGM